MKIKTRNIKELANLTPRVINFLINHPTARKTALKAFGKWISKNLLSDKRFPVQVQRDKLHFAQALTTSFNKFLDQATNNQKYQKVFRQSFIFKIPQAMKKASKRKKAFKDKFGYNPPGFLVIGPGRFCNLQCRGCYASSSSAASEKLSWKVLNKIIKEKTESWGSWFTVITGGEPFLWKSNGQNIINLVKKHPDNLFLIYTNGTLINKKVAEKLAEAGNVTLSISVEGFEKETDSRRGKGVHKKVIKAMGNLREAGVLFGISLTATKNNAKLITSDKLMDYYFNKGVSYAWIFQLMPIGRGQLKLMVNPEQRLRMFRRVHHLVKNKKYPIVDFWNSGPIMGGCISSGRANSGYLYIEWNGNVTPCTFVPYAGANINKIYQKGGHLNDVLQSPFFQRIRQWQKEYALDRKPEEMGNWILPCPIRDHYQKMRKFLEQHNPMPIDKQAEGAITDQEYKKEMIKYDQKLSELFDPVWEKEYLKSKKVNKRTPRD